MNSQHEAELSTIMALSKKIERPLRGQPPLLRLAALAGSAAEVIRMTVEPGQERQDPALRVELLEGFIDMVRGLLEEDPA